MKSDVEPPDVTFKLMYGDRLNVNKTQTFI